MNRGLFLILCIFGIGLSHAEETLGQLEKLNEESTSAVGGKDYEREAISAFWGNAAFMRECISPGSPIAEALTIYLVISTDGEIKKASITPSNTVAQCIVRSTKNKILPRPDSEFVAKIDLSFTE